MHVPSPIVTDYAVTFVVTDVSVGLHLLILQHGHFTFTTFFRLTLVNGHTSVRLILPLFPCICSSKPGQTLYRVSLGIV
jgi:hypothetical protein